MYTRAGQVLVVEQPQAGMHLADLLGRQWPEAHPLDVRGAWTAGAVRVNGETCLTNRRLRAGDVVEVLGPMPARTSARSRPSRALPEVRFESAAALVVAKPPGMPTVPDRTGRTAGLHGLLAELRPGADLRIVHRLDRDTSGCLLLGKGKAAAQHFDVQFREGLVHKTYVALVHGVPTPAEFAIDAWLGPDRRRPGKVVWSPSEQPGYRQAHTVGRCRATFSQHALVELQPTTGRGHQLRVHLQSIGHPIVGDADYGGSELLLSRIKPGYKLRKGVPERPLTPRMFLHAERLQFRDLDGTAVAVETPLPEDLAVALRQLEAFDERRRRPCD